MSNNYRILFYFLSTLTDSMKVGLGIRSLPKHYPKISSSLFCADDCNRKIKNNNETNTTQTLNTKSQTITSNKQPNITINDLLESSTVVLEGLRQYAIYKSNATNQVKHQTVSPSIFTPQDFNRPITTNIIHETKTESLNVTPDVIETSHNEKVDTTSNKSSRVQNSIYQRSNTLSERSKERSVPSNRASRIMSFSGLALGLGIGAAEELTKRLIGFSDKSNNSSILGSSILLSESNAHKIVDTLCRVRGAALKLGQMLSIQDNEMLGPELQSIFERVRQSADHMPASQMHKVMKQELGEEWETLFQTFDHKPFAAASIGQVHQAQLHDGTLAAVKIQYPGVAESIESDIKNVLSILKYANVFPEGLFIDHIMAYAKKELSWEVDYIREAQCGKKYRDLVLNHCDPCENFKVPIVYQSLSTKRVLTTEMIKGIPIDKLTEYEETSDPNIINSILDRILRLFFRELFVFQYMQTDPNWSNFYYDFETDTINLIDFGSSRPFGKDFVNKYMAILKAAIDNDRKMVLEKSEEIGFLSGYESEIFKKAHIDSVMIIGESIREPNKFNFGRQSVTRQINSLVPTMLKYRLKPPPEEIYSLHRKLSGLFLLFTKLKAEINCRKAFEDVTKDFNY